MSRPRFLDCVMTPEIIRAIRNNQAEYDKDPAGYERREREKEERVEEERQAEQEFYRRQQEDNF